MNHELETMSRLVDYHDHIYAPPASLTDDLNRGRRRVRRNRGMLSGGLALGLVSVVAAASLFTGGGLADRTQPAGPPTTDTTSDPAPNSNISLVAPESLLDVTELGFHLESVAGVVPIEDWSLAPDHQRTTVKWADQALVVRVYYPGKEPEWQVDLDDGQLQAVSVHGVTGSYFERYGGPDTGDNDAGLWESQLMWEYAPGAWATVFSWSFLPPPQATIRPAFLSIAEAVRTGGGAPTRLPFRLGTARGPIPPDLEDTGVGLRPSEEPDYLGSGGWVVSFYGEPYLGLFVDGTWCDAEANEYGDNGSTVQPFTYRGHTGCLHIGKGELEGQLLSVVLRVGAVDRVLLVSFGGLGNLMNSPRDVPDPKQLLAELDVAPLDDESTWFDLKTALGN